MACFVCSEQTGLRMKLYLERPYVEALVAQFPTLVALSDQLKFCNKAEVPFYDLGHDQLGYLRNLYEAAGLGNHRLRSCHRQRVTGRRDFVAGRFDIADATLFYVEFWADRTRMPLPEQCAAHYQRRCQRPAVRQVLREEGYSVA